MNHVWTPPDLTGRVAVVTGASRGVGWGIAEVLAECGATVHGLARTGPIVCDVGDDAALAEAFDAIGPIDVLVNNAVSWGTKDDDPGDFMDWMAKPPWKAPRGWWDANFQVGVRSHYVATNLAVPRMRGRTHPAVIFTSERQAAEPGMQELVLDLRATVVQRMVELYALHLRPRGIASVLLYPGFTRTEGIQKSFEDHSTAYFDGWTADDFLTKTASMSYAGRAAAVLAGGHAMEHTGRLVTSYELARAHNFTDTTGRQPDPI